MESIEDVLKEAIKRERLRTYKYEFINENTTTICNIQVTGVGLATVEYGGTDIDTCFEVIILMDNLQLFYLKLNTTNNCGSYFIADSLDALETVNPRTGLIAKAYDTIEYYPN